MHTKLFLFSVTLFLLSGLYGCSGDALPSLKEGDIVFQTTSSTQRGAILLATHSKYSHVGLILKHEGRLEVFEAVGPVRYTPVENWISHGRGKRFAIIRLKDSTLLTYPLLSRMESVATSYIGKPYDLAFDWSDDKMYCSEVVWKVFARGAGVELCTPAPLRSFDLSSPKVQTILHSRYGDRIPYDEPMVSPEQLYSSALFYTVSEN